MLLEKAGHRRVNFCVQIKASESKKRKRDETRHENTYEDERCKEDTLAREGKSNKKAELFFRIQYKKSA